MQEQKHIITEQDIELNPELKGQVEPGEEVTLGEPVNVEAIAMVCHEANRAYCKSIGDTSQLPWEDVHGWQRESALKGVAFRLQNPEASPVMQHDAWMSDKVKNGWVYGEVKDAEKKTHHCIVPYNQLPIEQRRKDYLFQAIVDAMIKD